MLDLRSCVSKQRMQLGKETYSSRRMGSAGTQLRYSQEDLRSFVLSRVRKRFLFFIQQRGRVRQKMLCVFSLERFLRTEDAPKGRHKQMHTVDAIGLAFVSFVIGILVGQYMLGGRGQ